MNIYAKILLLYTLVWNSFINAQSTPTCPNTVPRNAYLKTFNGQCYQFVTTEKNWNDALSYCKQRGGTLVEVRSPAVQSFLVSSLKSLNWTTHGVWLGLSDQDVEGTWRWTTGDKVSWTNWDKGEGPNHHGFFFNTGGFEDCAHLRLDHDGKWHDAICTGGFGVIHYSYVCQYNMVTAIKSTARPTTPLPKLSSMKQKISTRTPLLHPQQSSKQDNILNPTTRQKPMTPKVFNPTTSKPRLTIHPQTTRVSNKFITPTSPPPPRSIKSGNLGSHSSPVRQSKPVSHSKSDTTPPPPRSNKSANLGSHSSPVRQSKPVSHSKSDTNLIVGVIVGTVCGMSLIFGVMLFVIKKRRMNGLTSTSVENPLYGEKPKTISQENPQY